MADDKNGREDQARDADLRQRERDMAAAQERRNEPEPPFPAEELEEVEATLESIDFPATGADVVATVGDHAVDSLERTYTVAELVPEIETETFDSPAAVSAQVERPTVASAMKRVLEASATLSDPEFPWSQRKAYEKTFAALAAVTPEDDDEGVRAIADWVVDRLETKGALPSSRAVRREAAKFCRSEGYEIRVDDWLGI